MISKKRVLELVEERIAELGNGLFVVDISISANNSIHVELDKEEGYVAITDCMSVSRNVEHNLDREQEDFELHVSSAGLDKPFRVLAQFTKNIGREVKLVKVLCSATSDEVVLETSKLIKPEGKKKKERVVEQLHFPMSEIKEVKIVISFK
jgi:ribosome maturation factor RimP